MPDQTMTTEPTTEFDRVLHQLLHSVSDQLLVSKDRCMDGLLDLFNCAPTEVVRRLVIEAMDGIRHQSAVRAADLRAELDELSVAHSVEAAFFA